MAKQFDVFSLSGEVVAKVIIEETTLVRDILQQISDITGTPTRNMSLVHSGDQEAPSSVHVEDSCLSKECFVEGAQISLTVVILDNGTDVKNDPAEVSAAQGLDFHYVVKKLTPCIQNWFLTAIMGVGVLSVLGLGMGAFMGFIFCCVAMSTEEGPTLLEKICFGITTSAVSISLICFVAWSAHKAIAQGKFYKLLQNWASMVIGLVAGLGTLGLGMGVFVGFMFCCIAMSTEEGPNVLEKICFGITTSAASISLICFVAWSAHKAIAQGKFCKLLQSWASMVIRVVAALSVLGLVMGAFMGFIFCCVAMSTEEGPNVLEKICFGITTSAASISLICFVACSAHKAIAQGKFYKLLQNWVSMVIGLVAGLGTLGLGTGVFVGFIFCCIAMSTEEGPNVLEKICFGSFVSGAACVFCGFVCMQIRDALKS